MSERDVLQVSTAYATGFREALRLAAEYADTAARFHEKEAGSAAHKTIRFRYSMPAAELAALKGQHWRILERTILNIPVKPPVSAAPLPDDV